MTVAAEAVETSSSQHATAVDYSQHFGQEGHARQLASLRVLLSAFTGVPGIIGLHGGLPPADAFPFTEMSFTLRDGTKMQISDPAQVTLRAMSEIQCFGDLPVLLVRSFRTQMSVQPCMFHVQVAAAQQYSVTLRGYPALYEWVKKHTWALHNPPADHDVVVTSGSNHTIEVNSHSYMDVTQDSARVLLADIVFSSLLSTLLVSTSTPA